MLEVDASRQASRELQEYLDNFRTGDPRLLEQPVHRDSEQAPKQRLRGKSAVHDALMKKIVYRDSALTPERRLREKSAVHNPLVGSISPAAIGLILDSYYSLRKLAHCEPGRGHGLPDFMIIGFQKCGTTSLFDSMCEHPLIKPPMRHGRPDKELYYFDYNYQRREGWYRLHFATDAEREAFAAAHGRAFLTGDGTVSTVYHAWANERVRKLLPNVKLIVCLRNPVDRVYSAYHHSRRHSLELADTFEEALALGGPAASAVGSASEGRSLLQPAAAATPGCLVIPPAESLRRASRALADGVPTRTVPVRRLRADGRLPAGDPRRHL